MQGRKIVPPYMVQGYEQTGSYTDSDEGDRKVLSQLIEAGSDLSRARHSIHYFYFGSQAAAEAAGDDLLVLNFDVQIGEPLPDEPSSRRWAVMADRTEIVNESVIRALRPPLTEIAERHGGEYDGWEAQADGPVVFGDASLE